MTVHASRKIMLALVVLLLLILTVQMLWIYQVAPRLAIRKIILDGDEGFSDARILEMLQVSGKTWTSLNEAELTRRLESCPAIQKARVSKIFPDTLKVFLFRRKPLAVVLTNSAEGTVPEVFDEEGFSIQKGAVGSSLDLPVISLPEEYDLKTGRNLPESFYGTLRSLARLRSEEPRLFSLVSEVELLVRRDNSAGIRLYMNHVPVPVLVGEGLDIDAIRQAVLVLDILGSGAAGAVEEADLRGEYLVFRRPEEI